MLGESISLKTLANLLVGWVSRGTSSNGVGRVVAKIEPLAGLPSVPSVEREGSKLQVGHIAVHQVPQGSSVGFGMGRREHSRRSGCEKMKSGLMGNPMP